MTDTPRTEAELLTIFGPGQVGTISSQDMRDFVKSTMPDIASLNTQVALDLYHLPDYTLYKDSGGYYARDERLGTQPFTGSDLSSVWNPVAQALNNNQAYNGSGGGFWDNLLAGGSWAISRPSDGSVLSTNSPLFVYNGQTVVSLSSDTIIQASSSFPNTGTLTNGLGAVISCGYGTNVGDTCLRVRVFGLTVDGNSRAAQAFLYRRNNAGSILNPGSNGLSRFAYNEGYNFTKAGMHTGLAADAVAQTGSSNVWWFNNFIHAGTAGSYGWYNATGDCHALFNNIVQDRQTGSVPAFIDELAVFMRENHIGWQGSTVATPNANIIVNTGSGHFIMGNYIDNAGANGQAAVSIDGGNSVAILVNHVNWSDSDGTGKAAFYISGSQSYVRVLGNRINGPTATANAAEIIRAASTAAPTAALVGNFARGVKGFYAGTKPAEFSGNQINTIAGVTQSNSEVKVKAGAPVDGDYVQAYDGIHAFDSTNVRDYWRHNGTWRYSQMV